MKEEVKDIKIRKEIDVSGKLVGVLQKKGNKEYAEKIVRLVLEGLKGKYKKSGEETLLEVIEDVRPLVIFRLRKLGGITYRVPYMGRDEGSYGRAVRWIVEGSERRNERNLEDRVLGEIIEVKEGGGFSRKKRLEWHNIALANRPFIRTLRKKRRRYELFKIKIRAVKRRGVKARGNERSKSKRVVKRIVKRIVRGKAANKRVVKAGW